MSTKKYVRLYALVGSKELKNKYHGRIARVIESSGDTYLLDVFLDEKNVSMSTTRNFSLDSISDHDLRKELHRISKIRCGDMPIVEIYRNMKNPDRCIVYLDDPNYIPDCILITLNKVPIQVYWEIKDGRWEAIVPLNTNENEIIRIYAGDDLEIEHRFV